MIKTRIAKVDGQYLDREVLAEAGKILKAGGLVAFPTETVYGLGGDALPPAGKAQPFFCGGFYVYLAGVQKKGGGDVFFHLGNVGGHFRLLGDDGGVYVFDDIEMFLQHLSHPRQKLKAGYAPVFFLIVRGMHADVAQGGGA